MRSNAVHRGYLVPAFAAVLTAVALAAVVFWATRSSATDDGVQGDADCDMDVDRDDALTDLRFSAGLGSFPACTARTGDADCDGQVRAADAVRALRHGAGLPPLPGRAGCPPIGARLPTPAPTPAPTATPAGTQAPTPTPGGTPSGTPVSGGYALSQIVPSAAFEASVDFAIIPGTGGQQGVVVTQDGRLHRVSLSGAFQPALFGDIADRVSYGGEEGLLSIAFSPGYETDRRVYLYYTRGSPQPSVLSRFAVAGGALDPNSETVILQVPQPFANHNGGRILFGHDGYLYLSLGDGGSGGDPEENGQDVDSLLGKLLRLDVSGQAYTAPPDNPFVGVDGRDEIYAYGLRNPWRFSVDSLTGDLWLGDVGQNAWEEVDKVVAGGNYGWDCYEGLSPFELAGCPSGGFQMPRAVYGRGDGQAVTGGYVYRGGALPELYGWYVYADFYSGKVWAVDTGSATSPAVLLADSDELIASFSELPDGELAIVSYSNGLFRLARR
ncbi:MAG: PQQ-dependent sugar dehydrogenase [Dehalococcoidia bacterium]|nr:PQQ-dependent sugar dehydrogenase [Dehalococcoidia bacterium]